VVPKLTLTEINLRLHCTAECFLGKKTILLFMFVNKITFGKVSDLFLVPQNISISILKAPVLTVVLCKDFINTP
jgi:hypothetical protein